VRLSDFQYELPPELIAQQPAQQREAARLLSYERSSGERRDLGVAALPELLEPGDLLVFNDTRVLPARLRGVRASGGGVEFLFVEPTAAGTWLALVKPAKKLKPREVVVAAEGALRVTLVSRTQGEDGRPLPEWEVALSDPSAPELGTEELLALHGSMPLPPYIERGEEAGALRTEDLERYQTVFARELGAVAAPTAGLHFGEPLLAALEQRGIERAWVTLHVGPGTFRPVTVEDVSEHRMHTERYRLSQDTVERIESCRARGGRVVAVGTTTVRVLESCADQAGVLEAGEGATDIFITPGYQFRVVQALVTNFHLPGSTLLMLVSAFIGRERTLELYEHAVRERYRFFSYGDAMLLR
jgi:S-adenosylmethionine:tRNA ribosyltransferase-isomerase